MLIGVPKEIKNHEYRVGLAPASVREVVHNGHSVIVETGAGLGIGSGDAEYEAAGASIVAGAEEIFQRAEMIVKVKEPQAVERAVYSRIRFCSPICIWPRTLSKQLIWSTAARFVSPMKR